MYQNSPCCGESNICINTNVSPCISMRIINTNCCFFGTTAMLVGFSGPGCVMHFISQILLVTDGQNFICKYGFI